MADWYYARGGEERGPVPLDKLAAAARAGKLRADDIVWTEGMAEWLPVSHVPELGGATTAASSGGGASVATAPLAAASSDIGPITPVTPIAAPEVAYYSDRGGMPERTTQTLKGFASPTGDVGVWPLDDAAVAQWTEACKQRKLIRSAHGLCRGLCALNAIFAVFLLFGAMAAFSSSRSGAAMAIGSSVALAVVVVFAVLFGLAASATRRNLQWGVITMSALVGLSTAVQLIGMFVSTMRGGRDVVVTIVINLLGLVLNVAFLWVLLRAIGAIKKFRASPAWCQELTAAGKL